MPIKRIEAYKTMSSHLVAEPRKSFCTFFKNQGIAEEYYV